MKKLLLTLLVLSVLTFAGVAVFLATFDVDQYRPQLLKTLERALGRPVELARLSLGWNNGIAVQLIGLAIHERGQPDAAPLIRVDDASAVVRLMPLLRRELDVASIVLIRPRMEVRRRIAGAYETRQRSERMSFGSSGNRAPSIPRPSRGRSGRSSLGFRCR